MSCNIHDISVDDFWTIYTEVEFELTYGSNLKKIIITIAYLIIRRNVCLLPSLL